MLDAAIASLDADGWKLYHLGRTVIGADWQVTLIRGASYHNSSGPTPSAAIENAKLATPYTYQPARGERLILADLLPPAAPITRRSF